ncbi:MAG: hypothetical protein AAGI50_08310 [Pseudomonadota bacterium]
MIRFAAVLVAMALAPAAFAQMSPARAAAEALALDADIDRDGLLEAEELAAYETRIFESLDDNSDGRVTELEFVGWRYGLAEHAIEADRVEAYEATIGLLFDFYDRDNDGVIVEVESLVASSYAHDYADLDDDGALSYVEFATGHIYSMAIRGVFDF